MAVQLEGGAPFLVSASMVARLGIVPRKPASGAMMEAKCTQLALNHRPPKKKKQNGKHMSLPEWTGQKKSPNLLSNMWKPLKWSLDNPKRDQRVPFGVPSLDPHPSGTLTANREKW